MKKQQFTASLLIAVLCVASLGFAQGKSQGKGKGDRSKANTGKQQERGQGKKPASSGKELAEEKRASAQQAGKRADKSLRETGNRDAQVQAVPGKGKNKQQQKNAFAKQIQHEQAKHLERQARLTRILELATAKNDTKTIDRVKTLIDKEKARYTTRTQRLQALSHPESPEDLTQRTGKQSDKKPGQAKDKVRDKVGQSSEGDEDEREHEQDEDHDTTSDHSDKNQTDE